MKKITKIGNLSRNLLITPILALTIGTACDSDRPQNVPQANKSAMANHIDYGEASDSIKQKFISAFSKKCVSRELKTSINKDIDEPRYKESCECIAKHIAEDLSDVDAEKFLQEHADTQTLEIKFDAAAYFCLQNKPQPKGPHLFGKPQ